MYGTPVADLLLRAHLDERLREAEEASAAAEEHRSSAGLEAVVPGQRAPVELGDSGPDRLSVPH